MLFKELFAAGRNSCFRCDYYGQNVRVRSKGFWIRRNVMQDEAQKAILDVQ